MSCYIIATLKDGNILKFPFPDRATVNAEMRCVERMRRHRLGLPSIFWRTEDGRGWCLSVYDFDGPLRIRRGPSRASRCDPVGVNVG